MSSHQPVTAAPQLIAVRDFLDSEHLDALSRAISNILDTAVALETYAQIIDGVPLKDVAYDNCSPRLSERHPINSHVELCPGALDKTKQLREEVDVGGLLLQFQPLEAFQSSLKSTRPFNLRLIELIASAIHHIAVLAFQLDAHVHDPSTTDGLDAEAVALWEPPCHTDNLDWQKPFPTLFRYGQFKEHKQYPNGVADMVGYWAEVRIIGGVVMFDRSQDWEDDNEPNIYIESGRLGLYPEMPQTRFPFQLTDSQQSALLTFLLTERPGGVVGPLASLSLSTSEAAESQQSRQESEVPCPLPIFWTEDNTVQCTPHQVILTHKVYRDIWERKEGANPKWSQRVRHRAAQHREAMNRMPSPEEMRGYTDRPGVVVSVAQIRGWMREQQGLPPLDDQEREGTGDGQAPQDESSTTQ